MHRSINRFYNNQPDLLPANQSLDGAQLAQSDRLHCARATQRIVKLFVDLGDSHSDANLSRGCIVRNFVSFRKLAMPSARDEL